MQINTRQQSMLMAAIAQSRRSGAYAGVMLSTLGLGLACGVGMYGLAGFATLFLLLLLWAVESHAPKEMSRYTLRINVDDPGRSRRQTKARNGSSQRSRTSNVQARARSCGNASRPLDTPAREISSAIPPRHLSDGRSSVATLVELHDRFLQC